VGCVMSKFVFLFRPGFAFRLALTGAAAGMLAGCSSSERLSDPLSNPFLSSTGPGSQPAAGGVAASVPSSPVEARPLAAPVANASPTSQQAPRTASLAPPHGGGSASGWTAQGGSPIVVAQGETAQMLSNRYGVPVDALVRTNGFTAASQIQPGTRLVIPVYNAALAASSGAHAVSKPAPVKTAARTKLLGAPPRTLASQAEALKAADARTHNAAAPSRTASLAPQETQNAPKSGHGQKTADRAGETGAASPEKPGAVRPAAPEAAAQSKGPKSDQASATGSGPAGTKLSEAANPEFRWPARGRIIQAFKPGGNDGINIALPEGTSIKAAESGVVAYAGNELKGYGNLILIRHPNGFVSAYANTSEIEVKRGETVKRGQTIAKSGQSGNVSTPQLHFELRKGTKPVDPTQYLAGV
jgi:murein DD-endopeptidase MepM/ murein hydrolase activator NlpD